MAKPEDGRAHRPAETGAGILSSGSAAATMDPFLQASNRLLAGWMAVGTELLEFSKTRLDQTLAMSKALAQTNSLDEAIGLQSEFARSAMQDYVTEANKIVDLGTRSLLDSVSPLRQSMPPLRPIVDQPAKHAEAAE
jgi:hypothetical protein